MATALHNLSEYNPAEVPSGKGRHFAVIVSEWNRDITDSLAQGAINTLIANGVDEQDIAVYHVPGTYELTYAAARCVNGDLLSRMGTSFDGVICLGCVIQGETRHFDFICEGVTNGISALNTQGEIPVIFGVLTTDNYSQAAARAGGELGNKGDEAAVTALKMCIFKS